MRKQLFQFGCALFVLIGMTQSTSAFAARTSLPDGFARVLHAAGLSQPTAFAFQRARIFVAEKGGAVRIVNADGTLRAQPYLTLNVTSDKERGLLGIAIDPRYRKNHYVYVYYTTGVGAKNYSGAPLNRLSRFKTKRGVGKREKILLDNIPSDTGYHNGGDLHFGFDKKLYVTIGDGGLYWGDAVELGSLRGKVLRLNRDGSAPPDNPFYNTPNALPQIFARGFRNPFRLVMRPFNSTYLVGDVGLNHWEEIDSLQAGGDYGWYRYEGPCPYETLACDPTQTDFGATIPPLHYYNHTTGAETGSAIIVGAFPKNSNYPAPYAQALFHADSGAGWVHLLTLDAQNQQTAHYEFDTVDNPVAFGTGPNGNVYVASFADGAIYKYVYTVP